MRSAPLSYERKLWREGYRFVAGVDEVGCGCWAGEVVAGAVILSPTLPFPAAQDSKKLSPKQRRSLAEEIKIKALGWAIGRASLSEIDILNIRQAAFLAMRRALEKLNPASEWVLADGFSIPGLTIPCSRIVKGDQKARTIAAASILAKVTRDEEMEELDKIYPEYGFGKHKGYGTAFHAAALQKHGPCALHRQSFEPVRAYVQKRSGI